MHAWMKKRWLSKFVKRWDVWTSEITHLRFKVTLSQHKEALIQHKKAFTQRRRHAPYIRRYFPFIIDTHTAQ